MISTSAIVLRTIAHTDKARIVDFYTLDFGRVKALVYGWQKKQSLYAPLMQVSLTMAEPPKNDTVFHKIKLTEVRRFPINSDLRISTIKLFIAEILYHCLKHPMQETSLFRFVDRFITSLDEADTSICHLQFMLDFSRFMGIYPNISGEGYLDMLSGEISPGEPFHPNFFTPSETTQISDLQNTRLTRQERQTLLRKLCRYYELQLPDFVVPNSLAVLQEVFD